jgi:predicted nuclease of predicted toxin-antitoxin system
MIKIKLDENLGNRGKEIFRENGFNVQTVHDEGLCSVVDTTLIKICKEENRVLVSLDLDFANPLVFKPSLYSGIAVIRLSSKPTPEELYECILLLANKLKNTNITGKLWIIQKKAIREYQEDLE